MDAHAPSAEPRTPSPARERVLDDGRTAVYRHPLPVRVWHWINVLCLIVLIPSGLQILNAHPALYWGNASTFAQPWIAFGSGGDEPAFPSWITLPSWQDLADGRSWHFFFAWIFVASGLAYVIYALASGRLTGVLWPSRRELRGIGRSILDHVRLRFPEGEEARRYNLLQKLSYVAVLFLVLPLMVATGLTMSPGMDARLHFLTELFGGRQSARTIHFLTACALVLFIVVHLVAMVAAGPLKELRSIVTGWFVLSRGSPEETR
ncbi:MAG TPA: cytochrome b/b6 domain-containing protein [Steroidobacteraceae bacterium]|nr:cytochrome b/b6 domain-containing protein [Steroidobacteraceae bacterium]